MKILLTGGAGFIGSHTCVELCDAGYEPVIVDNYINSSPESIRRIEQIVGHPVSHYEADVSDRAAMARIFDENSFDCVIHFAGLKAVGESVEKPVEYYRNNIDTTLCLLESMKEYPHFILSSGCDLAPSVSKENLKAYYQACNDFNNND